MKTKQLIKYVIRTSGNPIYFDIGCSCYVLEKSAYNKHTFKSRVWIDIEKDALARNLKYNIKA